MACVLPWPFLPGLWSRDSALGRRASPTSPPKTLLEDQKDDQTFTKAQDQFGAVRDRLGGNVLLLPNLLQLQWGQWPGRNPVGPSSCPMSSLQKLPSPHCCPWLSSYQCHCGHGGGPGAQRSQWSWVPAVLPLALALQGMVWRVPGSSSITLWMPVAGPELIWGLHNCLQM